MKKPAKENQTININNFATYKRKKSLWVLPWKYPESFSIALALFLASFGIEFITKSKAPKLTWPVNLIFLLLLANISLVLYLLSKKRAMFRWFYSIPASIAGITPFVVPSLLMALIPQKRKYGRSFYP